MSDRTTIRNFWMIFIASLALLVIVMAIATSSIEVTSSDGEQSGVRATIPATTPLNPPAKEVPWYERAATWLIGFVLTVILSGRFILLMSVLLFYGFIIAYIAPNAWQKLKIRLWSKTGKTTAERVSSRRPGK